jgi:hypothetical protein
MKEQWAEVERSGKARHLSPRATQSDEIAIQPHRRDVHDLTSLWSFDHLAVPEVHSDMLIAAGSIEQQVAGLDVIERYALGVLILGT